MRNREGSSGNVPRLKHTHHARATYTDLLAPRAGEVDQCETGQLSLASSQAIVEDYFDSRTILPVPTREATQGQI